MDKHADSGARAWQDLETAGRGRSSDGQPCPPVASLFRLAVSQARAEPPTAEGQRLLTHLEVCAVCRRTFRAARTAAQSQPATEGPSRLLQEAIRAAHPDAAATMSPGTLLDELADRARVPLLWRCSQGCVRGVVGRRVLLLLVDPADPNGDWGKVYSVRRGEDVFQSLSANHLPELLTWGPGQSIHLCLMPDDPASTFRLDWEGWGKGLRFVAIAPYPGSPDAAESLLNDLERRAQYDVPRIAERVEILRSGPEADARKALRQIEKLWTGTLNDILSDWPEVGAEALWIKQALSDTFAEVWKHRRQLPADPSHWLLETAGVLLYEIAQRRRAALGQPATAAPDDRDVKLETLVTRAGGESFSLLTR